MRITNIFATCAERIQTICLIKRIISYLIGIITIKTILKRVKLVAYTSDIISRTRIFDNCYVR